MSDAVTWGGRGRVEHDDELLTVRLTRKQWRVVHTVLGEMWSGPQDVLWDKLDGLLAQQSKAEHEPDVFGCDFYR